MYRVPEVQARPKMDSSENVPLTQDPAHIGNRWLSKAKKLRTSIGNVVEKSTAYVVRQSRGAGGKTIAGRHMSAQL